jgi:predicted ester cyclase
MTAVESNKAVVRRFYEQIDAGNFDIVDELVAEDYANHNPPPFPGLPSGREGVREAFRIFWEATPGHHVIERMVAEGDLVVTMMTAYGRHVGGLPGISETGQDLEMKAIAVHRVVDGRLVEHWSCKDELQFLRQLGVIPMP